MNKTELRRQEPEGARQVRQQPYPSYEELLTRTTKRVHVCATTGESAATC